MRCVDTVERHSSEHNARNEEGRYGCAKRVDGAGEVHPLHRTCTRQRIGGDIRIDDHLEHGGCRAHEERSREKHEIAKRHKVAIGHKAHIASILGAKGRGGVEHQSRHHNHERAYQRALIADEVEQSPRARTVEQIAQEESERHEGGQRVAHCRSAREKRYLERSLALAVDRGEESHDEIDECEQQERSCALYA